MKELTDEKLRSISNFQCVLASIYTSQTVLELFLKNREDFVSRQDIDPPEQVMLLQLPEQGVRELSYTLFLKRLSRVRSKYSLLFEEYPSEMQSIFAKAYEIVKNDPFLGFESYGFKVELVMLRFLQYSDLPYVCYELFLFQYLKTKFASDPYFELEIVSKGISDEAVPKIYPSVKYSYFNYSIFDIISNSKEIELSKISVQPTCYIFHYETKKIKVSKLSPQASMLLDLCSGLYSFEKIYRLLELRLSDAQVNKIRFETIPSLLEKKIIFTDIPLKSETQSTRLYHEAH